MQAPNERWNCSKNPALSWKPLKRPPSAASPLVHRAEAAVLMRVLIFTSQISALVVLSLLSLLLSARAAEEPIRTYENKLTPIPHPKPLLADHPDWVEPIRETKRWETP